MRFPAVWSQYFLSPGLKSDILSGKTGVTRRNLPRHRISCSLEPRIWAEFTHSSQSRLIILLQKCKNCKHFFHFFNFFSKKVFSTRYGIGGYFFDTKAASFSSNQPEKAPPYKGCAKRWASFRRKTPPTAISFFAGQASFLLHIERSAKRAFRASLFAFRK